MLRFRVLPVLCALLCPLPAAADTGKAVKLAQEAQQLLFQKGDRAGAEQKATQAIDEDPQNPEIWMVRANLRSMMQNLAGSLTDTTEAIRLAEANPKTNVQLKAMMYYSRAAYFRMLDRYADMLPDAEKAIRLVPGQKWALAGRGSALVGLGDAEGGLALLRDAATGDPTVNGLLALAAFLRSDMDDVLTCASKQPAEDLPAATSWKGLALCELGRVEEGWKVGESFATTWPASMVGKIVMAYAEGTPGTPRTNHEGSIAYFRAMVEGSESSPTLLAYYARSLFLGGRFAQCRDVLATRGCETNFLNLFWLGASQWRLDQKAEARETLRKARRLNPYLKAWAARIPGLAEFVDPIEAEIAAETKAAGGPVKLAKENLTWIMSVAEIETLVRRYQFSRASQEYGKLLDVVLSPVRKAEIEARADEVRFMASLLDKIVSAVNAKPRALKTRVGAQELTLVSADASSFEFTIPKGTGRFPWAFLDLAAFVKFAGAQALSPEEKFALGVLQWDLGDSRAAQEGLAAVLKSSPALKGRVTRVVARKRGQEPPAEGFVLHKGAFVTAEEKKNLDQGLVRFNGEWVPAADRANLAKGLVKVGDRWLPGEDAKLLAAGYRKKDGKWMSGEDYEALVSQWENALVQETPHYTIRSNAGEAFVKDLAEVVEVAYGELRKFYDGREPKLQKDEKMTLYAFRTYEDYRRHCVERKAEGQLNAAGFASSGSNVVAGWNKAGNNRLFLQTMVHEAAHLYYYRTSTLTRTPSWYMEGMATFFEGFSGSGGAWSFTYMNDGRVALAKSALAGDGFIPLKDLLQGDAGTMINNDSSKALVFYAECWAFNYFLTRTTDKAVARSYKEFRDALSAGRNDDFTKYFPDLDALEKRWREFAAGM